MKKVLAITLALAMIFSLAACGSSGNNSAPEEKKDRLAEIKERGYIEMVTEPYWAPNEFIDVTKPEGEQIVGLDIELGQAIADKIGVELKVVPLEFSAVQASTAEGKYDMAISALAYTEERAQAMRMSVGYDFGAGYGFLMREEAAGKYESVEDLKDAVVVTQSGSIQEGLFNQYVPECKELKLVSAMTDAYLAVKEGKADVCITDLNSAELFNEANGGCALSTYTFPIDESTEGTRVATPLEDTESLMDVINETIEELIAADKIKEWDEYYKDYAKQLGL